MGQMVTRRGIREQPKPFMRIGLKHRLVQVLAKNVETGVGRETDSGSTLQTDAALSGSRNHSGSTDDLVHWRPEVDSEASGELEEGNSTEDWDQFKANKKLVRRTQGFDE